MVKTSKSTKNKNNYIVSVGRRRVAIARVRLYETTKAEINGQEYNRGDVVVNEQPFGEYFRFSSYIPSFKKFFDVTGSGDKFIFSIKVVGGGKKGQLDAVLHGMARALSSYNRDLYRGLLKEHGYLTRDARARERRKVGMGGKARRKKQSPKR